MMLALMLWLAASLTGATLAASWCSHFQLGLLFVLLTAAPIAVYAWRRSLRPHSSGQNSAAAQSRK